MGLYSLLSPYIGSALAVAGLSKLSPTLQKFIGYGTAAGYGTDQIIDFLRSRAESTGYKGLKNKLEEGEKQGTLRPDEKADKEQIARSEFPADIAQTALSAGAGLAGGFLGSRSSPNIKQQGMPQQTDPNSTQQAIPQQTPAISPQKPQNAKEAVRQFNARPKPQKSFQQRMEEQFDKGYGTINPPEEKDSFYKKSFTALKNGRSEVDGKREQFLLQARPHYENGEIRSPEDLKNFHELLFAKRESEGQQMQQGQRKQPFLEGINRLDQTLQSFKRR